MFENNQEFARESDRKDLLKDFRSKFIFPLHNGNSAIYFLGNSLGLQPKSTSFFIKEVMEQWGQFGVEAFFLGNNPWLYFHNSLVTPLSTIVGARPEEIVVMNQLTVNLHLMLVSFYNPSGKKRKILCEYKAFPSDQYMLESHVKQRGLNPDEIIIEVRPREGEYTIRNEDLIKAIKENKNELALVFIGGVNYYTGQVFDMEGIAKESKNAGAIVGYDLAHAAGNVELKLHEWDVDFACWCSYKYLNSGPGAIGGVFIHSKYHNDQSINRFAGWWGNKTESRFEMKKSFEAIKNAEGWQLSTPSPLLYATHKAALDIFEQANLKLLFQKREQLSDYLFFLLDEINKEHKEEIIKIITPRQKDQRGSQVSILMKKNGKQVFDYLSDNGVFADWRHPDVIRVAPVPLYNTFEEVWKFVDILNHAIKKIIN